MDHGGFLKRLTLFIVMRLLGIKDLYGQLSQNPHPANRPGGVAILRAHLDGARGNVNDSFLTNCTGKPDSALYLSRPPHRFLHTIPTIVTTKKQRLDRIASG